MRGAPSRAQPLAPLDGPSPAVVGPLFHVAAQEREECVAAAAESKQLAQQSAVACMDTLNLTAEGDREPSCLVVGTESGQLLILNEEGSSADAVIDLPSTPALLASHGVRSGEYRINVACRDGAVYAVKDGVLMATRIEPGAPVAGLVRTEGELFVGCMGGALCR